MPDFALNNPDVRQTTLRERLEAGTQLIAAELAEEFDISLDTIRRDLLALEETGVAQRVRGGAVPVRAPTKTYLERRRRPTTDCSRIVPAALPLIKEGMTIILDGGTTLTHLAERIEPLPDLLVITSSPAIAVILMEKSIATHLIGGRLSPWGGVAVGRQAEDALGKLSADLAFVGICALEAEFGLSADKADEASAMQAMARAAQSLVLVCARDKVGRRARHHVLAVDQNAIIVTDADSQIMKPFEDSGAEIIHVK